MYLLLEIICWVALLLLFYTYLGYGLLLYLLLRAGQTKKGPRPEPPLPQNDEALPPLTLIVAAYNEEAFIKAKINDCLAQHYPADRLHLLFVTDGSTDRTAEIVASHPAVSHLHQAPRAGKIAAVNRAMAQVTTPVVAFSDANTFLNRDALRQLARHFVDPAVGAVAGEKRIWTDRREDASGAGEGFYWRYESTLKRWDAAWHSVVGAAGELFALRRECYEAPPPDTLIEDFYLSMRIAQRGYRVAYEPQATALERPSASVQEEWRRKVRIAAGGIQAVVRLRELLNPFRYGKLSFQYVSHRVLRWTVAPLALLLVFASSSVLALTGLPLYQFLWGGQVFFYGLALLGRLLEQQRLSLKVFFVPYYFCVMNAAVVAGWWRYLRGQQSVLWERAARRSG
jgi:poly-beta-1,6-N-acetyl-D-glucosamine synthase